MRRVRRNALALAGMPLAVVPLLAATLLGSHLPWERILRDLPAASGADYDSRFATGFAPLREGYIRQLLGEAASVGSTENRFTSVDRGGGPVDPLAKLPIGGGVKVSPGPSGDPPLFESARSWHPSISADGSVVAYLSNDRRVKGMGTEPCVQSLPGPTAVSILSELFGVSPTDPAGPCLQVVVKDIRTGEESIASVGQSGSVANSPPHSFMLSGNGRFIVFGTAASNLVPGDVNDAADIFVRDLVTERTELISVSIYGGPIHLDPDLNPQDVGYPVDQDLPDVLASISAGTGTISYDGQYVAFESSADDLVSGDTRQSVDVFVRDRVKGRTERVSLSSSGEPALQQDVYKDNNDRLNRFDAGSAWPCMSPNGRYVAFRSFASNFVPNDRNDGPDVFLRDRLTARTELVTVSSSGMQQNGDARPATGAIWGNGGTSTSALKSCISDDGRSVVLESGSTNLVDGDTNGQWDIFLRDRRTSTTRRVNLDVNGREVKAESTYFGPQAAAAEAAALSPDGTYIAFQTLAKLDPDDPDPSPDNVFPNAEEVDVFVYDIARDRIARLGGPRDYAGTDELGSGHVGGAALTNGAALVAFHVTYGYEFNLAFSVHIYRWRRS